MKLYCTKCQQMKCNIGELVCDDCMDKVRCSYCGKINSRENSKNVTIWLNGRQVEMLFCKDGDCSAYYQMGAEG